MKHIPLSTPYFNGNEWKYVKDCIDTSWVSTAGNYVNKFEKALCKYTKAKYAVACVNGTSGLHIALKLCGVEFKDEIIAPTITFIAPINTIKYVNAEPIFMDCDDFMNIDPDKISYFCKNMCTITKHGLKNKKTKKIVKAIILVHIFGNPCNIEPIMKIAKKYKLKVIEDATESLGSFYNSGKYANFHTGTIGDLGIFSFNGNKIITTGGGGAIVTNSKNMAEKAHYLTNQAKDDQVKYIHNEIGYNYRLTNLQAALGLAQIEQLNKFIKTKKINYFLYKKYLSDIPGITLLDTPSYSNPNYWFYSLLIDQSKFGFNAEQLMSILNKQNIQSRPLWYLNHLQIPYLKNQVFSINKAIWFHKNILNIPCSSHLKQTEITYISKIIKNAHFYNKQH